MTKTKISINGSRIKLTNTILSFPKVYKPTVFEEGQTPKYSASFMIKKEGNEDVYKVLRGIVNDLMTENKITKDLPEDNVFLIDGDDTGREEYEGYWIVKAKSITRPTVVNRDLSPLYEDDGLIYGGCVVNAVLDSYYFKHASGKRYILCGLKGIQWVDEGTPFGNAPLSSDAFDDLNEEIDDL